MSKKPAKEAEVKVIRGTAIVLEDSSPTRKVVIFLLEKNGYKVLGFPNGKVAFDEISKAEIPDLKIIFSDIMMPEMHGLQFIKKLRESNKCVNVPIVITSALSEKEAVSEAKQLGVSGYLLKPISAKKVIEVLKKIIPAEKFKEI